MMNAGGWDIFVWGVVMGLSLEATGLWFGLWLHDWTRRRSARYNGGQR